MKGETALGVKNHVVIMFAPTAAVANTTTQYFTMENASHADIIVTTGAITSASTMIIYESPSNGGTGAATKAFNYYYTSTANSDLFSAIAAGTTAGVSTGTTAGITFIIPIDAAELTDGYPWVGLYFSVANSACKIQACAVLSGLRYASDIPLTAIS